MSPRDLSFAYQRVSYSVERSSADQRATDRIEVSFFKQRASNLIQRPFVAESASCFDRRLASDVVEVAAAQKCVRKCFLIEQRAADVVKCSLSCVHHVAETQKHQPISGICGSPYTSLL